MPRKHALAVAALLGLAAVTGTVAAVRTTSVGVAAKPAAADTQLVQRAKRLDAVEASLARALKNQPPALPALRTASTSNSVTRTPASAPVAAPAPMSAPAPASAAPVKIVYQRPAPIVVTVPRAGGGETEHEQEHDPEAAGSDEGDDD